MGSAPSLFVATPKLLVTGGLDGVKLYRLVKPVPMVVSVLNRKNCCVAEIGLVSVYCQSTTTGGGKLVVQTGESRFVVDCKEYSGALVGHVNITLAPEGMIVSSGTMT